MNPLTSPSPFYTPHHNPLTGIRPLSETDTDSVAWVGGLAADFANRLVSYIGAFMPTVLAVAAIIIGVGLLIATGVFLTRKF